MGPDLLPCPICGYFHRLDIVVLLTRRCIQRFERMSPAQQALLKELRENIQRMN